jgi:phosphoenolpyruvate synthase/pyruvate phosphate dikinase
MEDHFGPDGSYGVFVRSDTNVEDLPGFTGAGLNLTVPNVVGFENVLQAIKRVWASPFTERAYGWRQAVMDEPEHVYPAVLLHKSVMADKSGVMITADVDTGTRDALSVVVNEGVGGGVAGQSAESLRIDLHTGEVRLLASATAATKRVLLNTGGSKLVPASGAVRVLDSKEIASLLELESKITDWFSAVAETGSEPSSADVEFGFKDGRLVLFQIRPFVHGDSVQSNSCLLSVDAALARTAMLRVLLDQKPLERPL